MKLKLSFRETLMASTTVLVVLYFTFDFFLYTPKQHEQTRLERELKSFGQKIQDTLAFFSAQSNLVAEIAILERKLSFVEQKFTQKGQFTQFLEELANQCQKLNLEVLSLKPREEKSLPVESARAQYRQIVIDMELRCDYRTLVLYLQSLEKLPGLTIIEQLEIHREEAAPRIICHLVLKTLFS